MKKLYSILAACVIMLGIAQNTSSTFEKTEIVEVAGATAQTLNQRATVFLKSKKIESKTAGAIISGVGKFTVTYPSVKRGMQEVGNVNFKIVLSIKDAKYRVVMSNFTHEGIKGQATGGSIDLAKPACTDAQLSNLAWIKIKEQTHTQTDAFIEELKANMANPSKEKPSNTMDF